jgi:ankyrin repeat protein
MWAVARHQPEIVDALLAAGADVHARSKPESRVVLLCCPTWAGDPEGTVTLDQGGLTPLLFAALDGDVDSARKLLAAGADVDAVAAVGTSVLVMAVHRGYRELVTLLLEAGANPNAAGAGYTALHSAVLRGDADVVERLLDSGADLNPRLANGTFLKRGSREYAFDKFLVGATPFLLAARAGDLDVMRRLASAGANLSIPLEDGRTPLMVAAAAETDGIRARLEGPAEPRVIEAVKLLLELGADVNAVDKAGNTVVHVIARGRPGFDNVLQLLADHGAALDVVNHDGETPLTLALAPPAPLRGQSTSVQTLTWREARAAWEASEGRTSTTDLLRKLGAQK